MAFVCTLTTVHWEINGNFAPMCIDENRKVKEINNKIEGTPILKLATVKR